MNLQTLFSTPKPVIGVVHLLPLPGSPNFVGELDPIIDRSLEEVRILKLGGVDGVIIENFHDMPFLKNQVPLEQFGIMASILTLARQELNIPLGVNVHFNDWKAEVSLAYTCKAQFVRVEGFVDTIITASGIVEPCCAEVTRYRKYLNASEQIQIWADIHPKYSKNIISYSLQESAKMAEEALADCIIVTGETTGIETPLEDIHKVKSTTKLPVLAGSGTNLENLTETLSIADGVIVGSAFKNAGDTKEKVSLEKVSRFMKTVRGGR